MYRETIVKNVCNTTEQNCWKTNFIVYASQIHVQQEKETYKKKVRKRMKEK